jgi:hypothetical protein
MEQLADEVGEKLLGVDVGHNELLRLGSLARPTS